MSRQSLPCVAARTTTGSHRVWPLDPSNVHIHQPLLCSGIFNQLPWAPGPTSQT